MHFCCYKLITNVTYLGGIPFKIQDKVSTLKCKQLIL